MAARRLAKSTIDWASFSQRVAPNQKENFRLFKAKCEGFINSVHQYPEALPAVDFSFYKSRIATPAMVDQFEKAYKSLTVPYPKDAKNLHAEIDAEKNKAGVETKQYMAELQQDIVDAKVVLDELKKVPTLDDMTQEMFCLYFPEQSVNPDKPTHWPHTPDAQKLSTL